jgi:uncharacterized repeat protein (TIGR03833 family)
MTGNNRENIKPGQRVRIVLKANQRTGKLTEGLVKDILTNSPGNTRIEVVELVHTSGQGTTINNRIKPT